MMEGLNQAGQEEFIWAMRTSTHQESDSELWKHRRSSLPFGSAELLKNKSRADIDTRQTKVMASLVPDEVIFNVNDYTYRSYDACFLFGDVSGFTDLCEKYNETGVSGPSRMTQVLNKYLGSMVQEVLSHNGDVLKFSGDAFLAVFKNAENETMRDAVHEALDCALVIQKTYGSYLTDVGIVIRVKLAISAGHVNFALIGDEHTSHYVVVGKPIWDVKAAESISSAGDIIVAPGAWHYVNTSEYLYQEMIDGIHMKLIGVGPNWRSVQKAIRQQKGGQNQNDNVSDDTVSADTFISGSMGQMEANEEFLLRPAVNVATRMNIKHELRKFIIAPVMKSIDMDEPFEYLTEMRQSVIVFINVVSTKLEIKDTVLLCDLSYKIVCSVVHPRKGCVNKVSLFDKDLMFVVIFGLRGLKDELECQIALRCATECHDQINKLPTVISTSIGVTTGKTYCGVFGHTLRREYTVISLIVNKAARLMVAYKNKVTCDRETFLHSKMEAKNFVLQEPKPLKGITHPGPVYEFKEAEVTHDVVHKINPCPLLGREDTLHLYRRVFDKFLKAQQTKQYQYKAFCIKGNARQGKTRLMDELIYTSPADIPVNRFTLTLKDSKIPFQTIRLLFAQPMLLSLDSTMKLKERRLLQYLKKMQVPDLICVLNMVFGVNFRKSELFMSINEKARHLARKKMIKQLAYACFVSLWVIAIDNMEYIDDESWEVLDCLLDLHMVFIVATVGGDLKTNTAQRFVSDVRIKSVVLTPLDRWYLGALACQILEVYAIPPELEKVLQTISNGNPGWIESFLISLIQDEGLYIIMANYRQINDLGLVCPPLYLMTRMRKDETIKWKAIMEERRPSKNSLVDEDYWKRYIDSCRDSYLNVHVRERMETKGQPGQVPVCVLSPNFNIKDVEAELSLDVIIMKTFDSLNSYEQLLIKCSAILGSQFPRDMLVYVMSASKARTTALAVKKLFEIKVLTCAKGDFFEGATMLLKERLYDPNEDSTIKCECRGIKIEEDCYDLPRYASCGYMQFRSAMFRDITYSLLTDNQKKEFHYRAIRYLEKETRRCRACGNGFFDRILGAKHDVDLLMERDRKRRDAVSTGASSWDEMSLSRNISFHSFGQVSFRSKRFDEKSMGSLPSNIISSDAKSKQDMITKSNMGMTIIKKLKNSYALARAFSSEDFTDCQCNLILNTTYAQLIDHCSGANDMSKLIDAITEYSYICIVGCNLPLAMQILNEAMRIITIQSKEKMENWWKMSLTRARIYILIGYTRIELGQMDVALRNLHLALNEYGIKFPRGCRKKLYTISYELKQYIGLYLSPRSLNKNLDHWETIFANNLSECLSHLCTIFMLRERWDDAELAAIWSLNKSLECFSNFKIICVAYTNMIHIAQHKEKWNLCVALEVHALRLCHFKRSRIEAEDLKGVSKLYAEVFSSRIMRLDMERSVQIGYIALRLCTTLHAVKIVLPLLPLLFQCLMMGRHISNVISILQELDYFADEDTDNSGKVWYFALCMCFHMETGYNVISFEKCEKFYQIEGENWITIRDPDARKRYIAVMWLWCVRNEKWDSAALWCIKTQDFLLLNEKDSITHKFTALYVLEGMILYLVCKMDKRNIKAAFEAETEINNLMDVIEKSARLSKIVLPRLYHLKAYFRFVKYNDSKTQTLLDKAKSLATKYGNQMELAWIDHSSKAWSKSLPVLTAEFWRDHAEPDNLLNYRELEINAGKVTCFTLPTPLYV